MKKAIAILIVLIIAMGAVACLVGCQGQVTQEEPSIATSYVSMDINPSLRFVLDQNQKIMSYSCENDDALVLMYGETIKGMDIGDASRKIIDLAVRMGYLTNDNCVVALSVTSDDSQAESDINNKIQTAADSVSENSELNITCDKEGSFLLNYQLNKLKEKYPDDENYQNLTAGKLRLINSAKTIDFSLKMDDAVKMSTQDLLAIVGGAYDNLQNFSTKAFEQAKLAAEQVYQAAVAAAEEDVYIAKYTEYKGVFEGGIALVEYKGLSIAAKSINLIAKGVVAAQNLTNKVLANDDVLAIAAELGVNVDALKDEQGNVTVESVGAYVDKAAKNSADALTQDMREKLTRAVERLESSKEVLQDKPLSQEVITKIQTLLGKIDIKDINFVKFTVEDLKQVAVDIQKKASAVRDKMDASLTEAQKQSIEKAQQQAVSQLTDARAQYNQALAQAEQDARNSLQSIKNSRLESLAK